MDREACTRMLAAERKKALTEGLFRALQDRLGRAMLACDRASNDGAKDYLKQIELCREALAEADALHAEWYNLWP